MKQRIISSIQEIIQDRYLTIVLSLFLVSCVALIIYLGFSIRPSELQVVVHYTGFGTTNFYRDKWYYLLSFIGFIVVMAAAHIVVAIKLRRMKGHDIAVGFSWLGLIMVFIAASLFYQILKVASLS